MPANSFSSDTASLVDPIKDPWMTSFQIVCEEVGKREDFLKEKVKSCNVYAIGGACQSAIPVDSLGGFQSKTETV